MTQIDTYRDYQSSLFRFAKLWADAQGVGFLNLDAHADEAEWPEGDFLGIGEFNVTMGQIDEVLVTFAVATSDDRNLVRMGKLVNDFANNVLPTKTIPVLNADTGAPKGVLHITDGTTVGAPMKTEAQPLVPISLRLRSSRPASDE